MNSSSISHSELPCGYVPLSQYDWTLLKPFKPNPGCSNLPWNATVYSLISAFDAVTVWIGLELIVQLFLRFQRRRTLYFWSIFVSVCGALIYVPGTLLIHDVRFPGVGTAFLTISMVITMSGFSFILYSRLYLLISDKRVLRIILYCIITTSLLLQPPIIVTTSLSQTKSGAILLHITSWFDVVFSVQELILASLYIYYFFLFTKDSQKESHSRSTLALLILAEAVVLLTDVASLVFLFMKWFLARQLIRAFSYLVKIKIEFIVLNALVQYSQRVQKHANMLTVQVHELEKGFSGTIMEGVHKEQPWNNFETVAGMLHVQEPANVIPAASSLFPSSSLR